MTESNENLQACPACQVVMDVTDLEPLTQVACPSCGGEVVVSPVIAHYELIEIVGQGGMGVVYKARDTSLDRFVALKVLRRDHSEDAELVAQLETEASITASINHPYVVRVFTTGRDMGRFYIAMELVDKGTLDDLISLQGQVAEAQVLEIATQIAQGLRAAYQHGLIHRDVKPGNILFADAHTAKIVDFGLAMLEAAAAGGGEIWGTPYYVAPEKLDQKPEDFRSDIYSLGATLFHALAGRPPFEAENATMVALKHLKSQAVSLQAFAPHISGSTAYVINRTLLKDPDQRYSSYDEFIEHLEYARAELEKKGTSPQAKQRVVLESEEDQKLWSYVTFGMLGLVVFVGLGALWYFNSRGDAGAPPVSRSAPTAVTGGANTQQAKKYEAARQQLIEAKPAEAATVFLELGNDSETPAPMAQWSLAHAGLAQLLAGHEEEARATFTALKSREIPARGSQEAELGAFFRELANLMTSERPVPARAAKDFSRENYEAFAPLAAGVKNWQLAEFEEAGALLRQYQTASPRGEFSWISDYKPVVADYLADFSEYRGAQEMVKMATSRADQLRVSESLTEMSKGLRTKGKLAERFIQLKQDLTTRAEARKKELEQKFAADKAALNAARPQIAEQSRAWKFGEARQTLTKLVFNGDQARKERSGLLHKLDALIGWKSTLIAELPKAGTAVTLRKKDGSQLKGQIVKASESGVDFQGGGTVPWSDLSPESLLAANAALTPATLPREAAAQRAWQAGVFAAMSGVNGVAEKFLLAAAKARPEYVPALPLLLPGARPAEENLAKGAKATASDFVFTDQYNEKPEMALDGDPKTKWCAKQKGPKWLQVDLGEAKTISAWVVHHAQRGGESAGMNTVDFELQTSQDGQTWETVDRVQGNTAALTQRLIVPTHARYAKMVITRPARKPAESVVRIPEFELRGASSSGSSDLAKAFFEPSDWFASPQLTSHDIQAPIPGAADIDWKTGEIVVAGAGADIWAKEDSFQFASQKLEGDGQIIARVTNVKHTHEWAKAGLMFRESLDPNSKNVLVSVAAGNKASLQHRPTPGAESIALVEEGPSAPLWLKLIRRGDKFTASLSKDGLQWKEFRSATVPMRPKLEVGLAVTSHAPQDLCTALLEFVQISSLPPTTPVTTTGPANGTPQAGTRSAAAVRKP